MCRNRESTNQKSVGIIGAGVAGLVSAKVLKRDGFDVTVFEKESTIGGVWAESRAFPGLRSINRRNPMYILILITRSRLMNFQRPAKSAVTLNRMSNILISIHTFAWKPR